MPPIPSNYVVVNFASLLQNYRNNVKPPYTQKEIEDMKYGWFIGYEFLQENGLTTRQLVTNVNDLESLVVSGSDLTSDGALFFEQYIKILKLRSIEDQSQKKRRKEF